MSKMVIYEPAMCCPTGLCGVGVDPELLRISTVVSNLEKIGVKIVRYNLTSAPQEFIKCAEVNRLITESTDVLPIVVLDGKVVIKGRYPTNDEIATMLGIPKSSLGTTPPPAKVTIKRNSTGGCGCSGGKCC